MTRSGVSQKPSDGWYMVCDRCGVRTEVRPRHNDFPLIEFAVAGWTISKRVDLCPRCVVVGESTTDEPWDMDHLVKDFERARELCLKFYGREPQSPFVPVYLAVIKQPLKRIAELEAEIDVTVEEMAETRGTDERAAEGG